VPCGISDRGVTSEADRATFHPGRRKPAHPPLCAVFDRVCN
jgi:hypothetical protein